MLVDMRTGSVTYDIPGEGKERFTTEVEGQSIPAFLGDPKRKLCVGMALSKDGGVHCLNCNHVDHIGMEGAAHKGLTPEVRDRIRSYFRLE